jgi:trafficking kinesin-binding protein 1
MNISGLLASGADLLRRKLIGEVEQRPIRPSRNKIALSRLERKQLRSIRIMDKVESIGLENIMLGPTSNISPLALHGTGSLYAAGGGRGRANSPMTQLTSLKNMKERKPLPRSDDNLYHIDKETIRAVLNKGMSSDSLQTIASDDRSVVSTDTCFSDDSNDSYMKPSTSRRTLQRANIAAAAAQTRQLQAASRRDNDSDGTTTTDGSNPVGATDVRLRQMQRQRSRRNMKNGGTQRPDLGQVGRPNVRSDLGTVGSAAGGSKRNSISNNNPNNNNSSNNNSSSSKTQQPEEKSFSQGFVGSISSLLFGRKGGLL